MHFCSLQNTLFIEYTEKIQRMGFKEVVESTMSGNSFDIKNILRILLIK